MTVQHPRSTKGDITAIHLLRWLSAVSIVLGHSQSEMLKISARYGVSAHLFRFIEFGVGVDVFFLISGFLIYHVSRGRFGQSGQSLDFLKRRFVRVVPLYWLAMVGMLLAVLTVPEFIHGNHLEAPHVVMSFLMIAWPNQSGQVFPLLASGWTLNLEIYFYTIFAIGLVFREVWTLAFVSACLSLSVLAAQIFPTSGWLLPFYGQPMILEFAAGMFLSVLYNRGFRIDFRLAIALCVAAVLMHIRIRLAGPAPRLLLNGAPAALMFVGCVFWRHFSLPPPVAKFVRVMGDSSYALYLTSPFTINLVFEALAHLGVLKQLYLTAVATVASVAVAVAVHRWVERPMTRYGHKRLNDSLNARRLRLSGSADGALGQDSAVTQTMQELDAH